MIGIERTTWTYPHAGEPSLRDLDLRVEPLHHAPLWMTVAPVLKLRQMRITDNLTTRLAGAPLPPHA